MDAIVIGAGGHGKVVVSLLLSLGFSVTMILDDDRDRWGKTVLSVPVEGPTAILSDLDVHAAIVAIGDNMTRLKVAARLRDTPWLSAVHPHSWVHPSVAIGPGSVIFAGSIVQPDAEIGRHCIINTGVTVDHDCRIGNGAHLAPGCHLAGGVAVGEGSFLGVGVSVIPDISIGKGTIVGAGASVVSDLPDNIVAVGVPAKQVRSVNLGSRQESAT